VRVSLGVLGAGSGFQCHASSVSTVDGVATFACAMDRAGRSNRLRASSPGLTVATSQAFVVEPGTASSLVFSRQPPSAEVPGTRFAFIVETQDTYGNEALMPQVAITATLLGGGRTSKLGCQKNPVRSSGGQSRFVCWVTHRAQHLAIRVTAHGLRIATSTPITLR
jgi:hypothetical protein